MQYNYEINWKDLINQKSNTNTKIILTKNSIKSNKNSFKSELLNKNSSIKIKNKKLSNFIYIIFFLILFISLFFLTINVGFASPLKENFKDESIFSDDSATILLNNYIFEDNKKNNDTEKIEFNELNFNIIEYSKYRVKGKDTIESIASKYGLTKDTIILCNDIKKKNNLKAGKILTIPNQNGRIITIEKNDNLFKISSRYGVKWQKIADVNNVKSDNIYSGMKLFIPESKMTKFEKNQYEDVQDFLWPVNGKLTSYFGPRIDPFKGIYSYHTGIDIRNDMGTPIKSVKDGTVIFTGFDDIYGNNVILKHSDGYTTRYAHLQTILVKKGDFKTQKSILATMGSTGRSTGSHLHFEVRKYGKLLDPLKVLK